MIRKLKNFIKWLYWNLRAQILNFKISIYSKNLKIDRLGKVLIVSPHPDDETLGCGMLIKTLTDNNKNVKIIILSKGEASMPQSNIASESLAQIRKELSIKSIKILGLSANDISMLNFPDGKFQETPEATITKLKEEIEEYSPDTIFIPHPCEFSSDHTYATQVLTDLLSRQKYCQILYYCVWVYYHMPLFQMFHMKFKKSYIHKGDQETKLRAMDIYLHAKDETGDCYSGFLPKEFLKAVSANKELYFES